MSRKKIIIISVVSVLCILLTGFTTYMAMDHSKYKDKFFPGIIVNEVNIGGQSLEEAIKAVQSTINLNESFILTMNENKWEIPLKDIIVYNIETTLTEIYNDLQEHGFWSSLNIRRTLKKNNETHHLDFAIKDTLTEIIDEIKTDVDIQPENAEFRISSDKKVSIKPHKNGYIVSVDETIKAIKNELTKNNLQAGVVFELVEPDMTTAYLESLKVVNHLSSTATNYAGTGENRIFNIQRAASRVKNHLLLPGDTFSYNEVVGPANKANGFKEALIIVNGEFVPGFGGGVCQLSSNIYWGALKADLEIVQRKNHGRPVGYMPLGLDATIAYPSLDLKFKNNTPYGVLINTVTTSTHVTVDFYSYKPHYPDIKFEHEKEVIPFTTEYRNNENLSVGEEKVISKGSVGYKVKTYRLITRNGTTKRELLNNDTYRPAPRVIERNKNTSN
ncbi:VanW family protein [Alkalicella caledoniensis]|uniref:VanW family protein n=1 Tax=Alkalicella caledoniensis TaxID=2731377 RepID=A0A7G9WCU5_ALKCA|nr:VanW family protein [Alkalicella caledoniensis]QNO16507.1 VanW family protein [Alkalicella caledoniensis]